ncbi:hypothetical protein E2562_036252 [Oryza meyeriana var. granulata]|uniref:DUF834 domain-containing protein n=1 Tax=Oryza meyeriana var. granulata TaxID=110450 RepID=A0A6G1CXA1_9ORYZ|nr:hypothetical protein E2562_036252 [Oryza meyeriana var. granulata]
MCGASLVQAEARLEATTVQGRGSPGADAGVGRVTACGWIVMGGTMQREGEVCGKEGDDLRASGHGGSGRRLGAMDGSGYAGLGICAKSAFTVLKRSLGIS